MLLRFRFSNHLSFAPDEDDMHELSWVATRGSELPDHLRAVPGLSEQALPVLALYGGNASGKSNAIDALEAFRWHVLRSYPDVKLGDPLRLKPFKLDRFSARLPTTFDVDVVVDGVRYRYGFRATRDEVLSEWLHAWPKGRQQVWFERDGADDATWHFGSHWRFAGGSRADLVQRASVNRLLLSVAGADRHPLVAPLYGFLASIEGRRVRQAPSPMVFGTSPLMDAERRPQVEALLRAADVGVTSFRVVGRRQRVVESLLGTGAAPGQLEPMLDLAERVADERHLVLRHRAADGDEVSLEPEEESDGTIALVTLLHHALTALEQGSLLVVDELDRALHTALTSELVGLFTSPASNPRGAQLLLSTHDTGLMDLLRRDEIVLVEKDATGRSRLTPASDFQIHKRESLRALYECKRLGGTPRVTSLARALRAHRAGGEAPDAS